MLFACFQLLSLRKSSQKHIQDGKEDKKNTNNEMKTLTRESVKLQKKKSKTK